MDYSGIWNNLDKMICQSSCINRTGSCVQAGHVLSQGYVPEKVARIEHKIPIWKSVFPGG